MAQTPNLLITEIAANQNQKEVTANTAFVELEAAMTDVVAITMTDADYTLSATEGGQALGNLCFNFTGTLTAIRNIIVPTNKKLYAVANGTAYALTVKTPSGTGISIPAGQGYTILYCDGTNVVGITITGLSTGTAVNNQTGTGYTAALVDNGAIITMTNASANAVTVPPNSGVAFPIGSTLTVIQNGAGTTSFLAGAGVTLNNPSTLSARVQYSTISAIKIDTNTWIIAGDLQ